MYNGKNILCLFDIDGTLTKPRQAIDKNIEDFLLNKLKTCSSIGLVGGSDFSKICEQMNGDCVISKYDYIFAENGLIYYKRGVKMPGQSILNHIGEKNLQEFINFVLRYLSTIVLPFKRGTFIEFRNGLINVSPVGRNCLQSERDTFENYDKIHKIRENMIEVLKNKFSYMDLTYSIGGQISFDVFPKGWDKTYCLNHLEKENFDEIHFFGDKTEEGGNDYEIYHDSRVKSYSVSNPSDTIAILKSLFFNN